MLKKHFITSLTLLIFISGHAQFHTLKIPQRSNHVIEQQQLAVTDIILDYSSPSVNKRDVWNDPNVIPQYGNPIAWRAGANMNTTIEFTTNVKIEGKELKAGKYGFHIIPKGEIYTLLFAHNNNQWGSYYLDLENDVTLSIDVKATNCTFSEKLDFEFFDWKENSVKIGLEWAKQKIAFEVSVNLNKTVVDSFRNELRGINTYHWQAWNDAANWCLNHNTNLSEALLWVNRSIHGGFNGFASNKNFTNISTKIKLLKKLNKTEVLNETLEELYTLDYKDYEAYDFSRYLLEQKEYLVAKTFLNKANNKHPKRWFLILNRDVANYFLGNAKDAISSIKNNIELAPKNFQPRLNKIIKEMESNTYTLPK
ncbi:DUF2911 domain-containing protein [Ichthyenterobacterium magnum]|uniref:DUF2911 family protein n=1 Tax=Ichthyenterobacterium magnum TaxID=1230530 RepID=A0A420DM24_9FLAO|nr:DUF2911 domain-containing protein [Ichthyenterobacterium magnum]RKE95245.1 Protein of unknown function (DUF2911) [Ichthyenterobacterium magnum]